MTPITSHLDLYIEEPGLVDDPETIRGTIPDSGGCGGTFLSWGCWDDSSLSFPPVPGGAGTSGISGR
jgi:hypothetical protein